MSSVANYVIDITSSLLSLQSIFKEEGGDGGGKRGVVNGTAK